MDPEMKALLDETLRLSQENNKYLRSMRRYARINLVLRIVFWAVILGVPVFLWHLYFPETEVQTFRDISVGLQQFQEIMQQYR